MSNRRKNGGAVKQENSVDIPGLTFPRRLSIAAVAAIALTAASALVGAGGWAWALQDTQKEHGERLDAMDRRWATVQAYMCMECTTRRAKTECLKICGGEE